jgi:hypothetical protein
MKEYYPEGWLTSSHENRKGTLTPSAIASALANQTVLEGMALMCDTEHNLTVDLGCMKGIIPRCEGAIGISEGTTRDIALISRVGRSVCFVVTDILTDESGNLSKKIRNDLLPAMEKEYERIIKNTNEYGKERDAILEMIAVYEKYLELTN